MEEKIKYNKGISTKSYLLLKYIAIISMVIDHLAVLFYYYNAIPNEIYYILRSIGRLAIPIFSYNLIECFFFTQNKLKHLKELIILGVISQLPYSIFFYSETSLNISHCNIVIDYALMFMFLVIINDKKFNIAIQILMIISYSLILYFILNIKWCETLYIGCIYTSKIVKKNSILFVLIGFALLSFPDCVTNEISGYYLLALPVILIVQKEDKVICEKMPNTNSKHLKRIGKYFYPLHLIIFSLVKVFGY